jgi:predicted NodU family carbamoyl transferase
MYILGINAYHPDSSAAIISDGKLIAAAEEERFNRIKYWAGFPKESIRYCLQEAGIGLTDVDYIAINRDSKANLYKKLSFVLTKRPSFSLVKSRIANMLKIEGIKDILCKEFSISKGKLKAGIYRVEHHRAHLASVFFVSPFKSATAVSIDGFGDFTSCMVARAEGEKIKVLYSVNYPYSLGLFYTGFTQLLGFRKFGDEYKVMGLAAYGQPRYLKDLEEVLILLPNGQFKLDLSYFAFYKGKNYMLWNNTEPVLEDIFSKKISTRFGAPRKNEEEITPYHCDLAASLQAAYEKAFFHVLNYAYKLTGIPNLCLSGGCALNSLAKERQDVHLVIVGPDDEGYATKIRKCLSKEKMLRRATFTGILTGENKLAAFRDSDVFVLPSYSENFGIAVVEAMACQTPIVISNKIGIHREIERENAGIITECRATDIYRGIKSVLDNQGLAQTLSANAKRLAQEYYDIDKVAQKLTEFYRQAAFDKRG